MALCTEFIGAAALSIVFQSLPSAGKIIVYSHKIKHAARRMIDNIIHAFGKVIHIGTFGPMRTLVTILNAAMQPVIADIGALLLHLAALKAALWTKHTLKVLVDTSQSTLFQSKQM